MNAEPSWLDALDGGRIDWAKFPFPRVCAPILYPFEPAKDAFEREINDRHEAMALDVMVTGRRASMIEIALALYGPLSSDGAWPLPALWRSS